MIWVLVAVGLVIGVSALVMLIGSMLPKEHVVSRRVHFNATPAALWEIVSDIGGHATWRADLRRVERLPDKEGNPVWQEIDKRGQALTLETVESAPPRRLVRRIADEHLSFGGRWIYELGEYGEVTSLTITEDGEIYNPVFRFISRFIMGQSGAIDGYLRSLGKKLGVDVTITSA